MDFKTERQGIYKNEEGFLVNKDIVGLKAYKSQKKRLKKIDEVEEDIGSLKRDMAEIKEMLKGIFCK